jgi:hypothetical protein
MTRCDVFYVMHSIWRKLRDEQGEREPIVQNARNILGNARECLGNAREDVSNGGVQV